MSPKGDERQARKEIDRLLKAAGWDVCDMGQQNLAAHFDIAIREFPLPNSGFADFMLHDFRRCTSRPFDKPSSGRIAVKVINHLGDEVMKVFRT